MHPRYLLPIVGSLLLLQGCTRHRFVDHSAVLVRVNGRPITEEDYEYYARARNRVEPPSLNPAHARALALTEMTNTVILAEEARRLGMQNNPAVHFEIAQQRDYILARALVKRYLADHPVTRAQLKAAYAKKYRGRGQVEYRARQILVHSRTEAKRLIQELQHGARFSVLARRYSLDPGAAFNSGKLGWFTKGQMLPSFVSAVAALKQGEISPHPVRTEFGWHVVQLEAERMVPPPSLRKAGPALERRLIRSRIAQLIALQRAHARITHP
ncbi:MAG: peptidylprolyl isomerase [Acidiferrobacteraceae bacterium]